MLKKTIYISLILFTTQLWGTCSLFNNTTDFSENWINQGRKLIQCYINGSTAENTFKIRFHEICQAIANGVNSSFVPSPEIKNSASSIENENNIDTIKNSEIYDFLTQPYYHMLINKYNMGLSEPLRSESIGGFGNYNNIYNNLLCLKKDWQQSNLPSWYCGLDCSYTLLSMDVQGYPQYRNYGGPETIQSYFTSDFNQAGRGSDNYCDKNSVFYPLLIGWAERNISLHTEMQSDQKILINAPIDLNNMGHTDLYQHLVGSSACPNNVEHFEGCRVCDQFRIDSADYKLCQWGFNFNWPLAWISNGGILPNDTHYDWAGTINREGSLLKWFDHYWATVNSNYLCNPGACNFDAMKIPTPHFNFSWLKSLWGKKGNSANTNAGGVANTMFCKTKGAPAGLTGWDCSRFGNTSDPVFSPITQAEIDSLE
jgi:hypothetical protein